MPHKATAQNFVEMVVALGKEREKKTKPRLPLPINDAYIVRYCLTCGQSTNHMSTEVRDGFGRIFERITCFECGETREVCTR